jgi:hypothetical protein
MRTQIAAGILSLFSAAAFAQSDYPSRAIRLVVPWPPDRRRIFPRGWLAEGLGIARPPAGIDNRPARAE